MDVTDDVPGWTDEFSVNVKLFDAQHRRLLGMIARLETAMRDGRARHELVEVLSELAGYTREHFDTEEEVLNAHEYPWRDMHALEHRQFTAEMGKLRKQIASGDVAMSVTVLDLLKGWWSRHVLGTDKLYTAHLNARGVY